MQFGEGRGDTRRRIGPVVGLGLMGLGLLLALGVGAFFIYSWRAGEGLSDLVVERTPTPAPTPTPTLELPTTAAGEFSRGFSPEVIAAQSIFPGEAVPAASWLNPMEAEGITGPANPSPVDFLPVEAASRHTLPVPVRIAIPAIGVDSEVKALQILDLGDSRKYETPKNVVGHIPETSNAGEEGTAWFFGHLESPIQGEGNVFFRLPELPDLLRQEQVYMTVENEEFTYLYELTASRVLHEDDLVVFDAGEPGISLVTCVPRFLYDHRLVVTGKLVGMQEIEQEPA